MSGIFLKSSAALLLAGIALILSGWSVKIPVLLIAASLWLAAYGLIASPDKLPAGRFGSAYSLLRKLEGISRQKAHLLIILVFFLMNYLFWLATGSLLSSFLLTVFLFSTGAILFGKNRRKLTFGDFVLPALFFFGCVYSFMFR